MEPVQVDIAAVVPMQAIPKQQDRLTGVFRLYHQHAGTDPVTADVRFSRPLEHTLQPMRRRITVGIHAQPIDLHWLTPELAGQVLIENHNKTTELRMCYSGYIVDDRVPPKGVYVGYPDLSRLRIFATADIEVTVTVFPR